MILISVRSTLDLSAARRRGDARLDRRGGRGNHEEDEWIADGNGGGRQSGDHFKIVFLKK